MTPFWLMILISVAGVPLASSLTNILKRRNLPPLLSAYCLLKIVQITVEINIGHSFITTVQGIQENLINNSENKTLNFALVFTNYTDNFDEAEGGIGKIFLSIFQSPSFAFHETSLLTNIFLSVGILLFSPYLYIYSLEGAALAYFTSLSLGLDTSSQARLQYCLAGMLTNSCLALHLVPAPGSHVAGKPDREEESSFLRNSLSRIVWMFIFSLSAAELCCYVPKLGLLSFSVRPFYRLLSTCCPLSSQLSRYSLQS